MTDHTTPDGNCNRVIRGSDRPYPKTCRRCALGPCPWRYIDVLGDEAHTLPLPDCVPPDTILPDVATKIPAIPVVLPDSYKYDLPALHAARAIDAIFAAPVPGGWVQRRAKVQTLLIDLLEKTHGGGNADIEQALTDIYNELGCEHDNEAGLEAIHALKVEAGKDGAYDGIPSGLTWAGQAIETHTRQELIRIVFHLLRSQHRLRQELDSTDGMR